MRRLVVSAALAAALIVGTGGQAHAAPPPGPAGSSGGWSVEGGHLTWRSDERVPMGDAEVEFWSGGRLLGRPKAAPDRKTFTLDLDRAAGLGSLEVRAGGRRLDQAAPAAHRRSVAPEPVVPGPAKANAVDPGKKGPYRTVQGEYTLPGIKLPDLPEKVEMQAVVVAPKGAPGKRPLALFLHGRHYLCFAGPDDLGDQTWPCPAGSQPIPSHRGYLQAQELLASQGYVTVSISANGINGQDNEYAADRGAQARSSLVRNHLAKWADWAGSGRAGAPAIVRSAPRADLSRVFLMGHSRGGEGVSRAAMDTLTPPPAAQEGYHGRVRWTIRGMLLIGPTIFGQNPVPDVPSATILPGCDGDVSDLQGQMFIDETRGVGKGRALQSSLYVIGANHNFFNTEWTPGQAVAPAEDDFFTEEPDAVCTPGRPTRLTAQQQQNAGATYIAAAARLFVGGDDRVRPLLDGTGVRAPSADPARVLSHALGGRRTAALLPDPSMKTTGGARICEQITADAAEVCLDDEDWTVRSAHFVSFGDLPSEAGRYAAELTWSAAGRPMTLKPARPVSLAGSRDLALRLMVPPNTAGTRFGVAVTDTRGRRTALGDVTVDGLPGTGHTTSHWAREVRVPLKRLSGKVAAFEVTPRTAAGRAWLIDAWGWQPGTPAPQATSLPRIDIGDLTVDEGDAGTRTYVVPVRISGRGDGKVRFFEVDAVTNRVTSRLVPVHRRQRAIRIPVEVKGDTLFGWDEGTTVLAKAERGLVIGDYVGGVRVSNDDPMPTVTVRALADRVAEGGTLRWEYTLSAAAETDFSFGAFPVKPTAGTELSSTDVDPQWFRDHAYGEEPEPSRPLSETWLTPYVDIPAGRTSAELAVPTVADSLAEGEEVVELSSSIPAAPARQEPDDPEEIRLIGTVTD